MILVAAVCLLIGGLVGWVSCNYKWARSAKNKKVMVVDGRMYRVHRFKEEDGPQSGPHGVSE